MNEMIERDARDVVPATQGEPVIDLAVNVETVRRRHLRKRRVAHGLSSEGFFVPSGQMVPIVAWYHQNTS